MNLRSGITAALAASVAFAGVAAAMPTSEYLMKAGAGDLYEKKASALVLSSSKDAGIKKFANMMITDHTKSTTMVKSAAMKSGLHPKPPMLSPDQKKMIADLTAAKGKDRDALYVSQQKTAHQMALETHQDYASTGDKPALKETAAKIVPVVQEHISMLNSMPM
ncbi:putative membrane protein [Sphingomonas vulcanisoli]|uniref:Membrane protein n=1 Tax=Sphingomonas vulcanisoli TaxID=1658060 RepID=A0ABX0TX57_9SPHN|nr:DUF4142 domain-containing protein [Sphingomonas vulcanisoli]NIJ09020.1 putative membrane protein [Sphingomonas vulcanisoli]